MIHPRNHDEYIRFLELVSLVTEDWGKIVTHTNDYFSKGYDRTKIDAAIKELDKIQSPMNELRGLMEVERRKKRDGRSIEEPD